MSPYILFYRQVTEWDDKCIDLSLRSQFFFFYNIHNYFKDQKKSYIAILLLKI